jgi:hypothetical protein
MELGDDIHVWKGIAVCESHSGHFLIANPAQKIQKVNASVSRGNCVVVVDVE